MKSPLLALANCSWGDWIPRRRRAIGGVRNDKIGCLDPNVANLHRGKTRQGASDVVSRSLGQIEAYLTVREILAEASKGADGVLWREFSGFGRFRFATLG